MRLWLGHERLNQLARRLNAQSSPADSPIDFCLSGCEAGTFRLYAAEVLALQTLINGSLVMLDLYQFLDDRPFSLENNP